MEVVKSNWACVLGYALQSGGGEQAAWDTTPLPTVVVGV